MALIATVGGTTSNAYLTYAEANTIITEERGKDDPTWVATTQADAEAAIIWATFLLDVAFDYYGAPTTTEQRLRNPRSGLLDADGFYIENNVIPDLLKRATAELALYLIRRDRTKEPGLLGQAIKSAALGPLKVSTELLDQRLDLIPSYIASILLPIATLKTATGNSGGFVRLERT